MEANREMRDEREEGEEGEEWLGTVCSSSRWIHRDAAPSTTSSFKKIHFRLISTALTFSFSLFLFTDVLAFSLPPFPSLSHYVKFKPLHANQLWEK